MRSPSVHRKAGSEIRPGMGRSELRGTVRRMQRHEVIPALGIFRLRCPGRNPFRQQPAFWTPLMTAATKTASADPQRLCVFYDGTCPLCRREIAFYRAMKGAEALDWIDISDASVEQLPEGLTRERAMARFHVAAPGTGLLDGGDAFAALWSALPRTRWIGRIASLRVVRPLVRLGYEAFLKFRPRLQRLFGRFDGHQGGDQGDTDCTSISGCPGKTGLGATPPWSSARRPVAGSRR